MAKCSSRGSRRTEPLYDLEPRHKEYFRVRAVDVPVMKARGYQSIDAARAKKEGFPALAGLLIPRYGTDGQRVTPLLRPDQPRTDGPKFEALFKSSAVLDCHPSRQKYLAVGPKGWGTSPDTTALVVCEGPVKGDAVLSTLPASSRVAIVNLNGVWGWRGGKTLTALSDWESITLKGRRVYIVFDSDIDWKVGPRMAAWRLGSFLKRRGADVWTFYLPDAKKSRGITSRTSQGIDDVLASLPSKDRDFNKLVKKYASEGFPNGPEFLEYNEKTGRVSGVIYPAAAEVLAEDLPVRTAHGGYLWYYRDNVWRQGDQPIRAAARGLIGERQRRQWVTEILEVFRDRDPNFSLEDVTQKYINLPNGLLDYNARTPKLIAHTPAITSIHRIPIEWQENPGDCPKFDAFLKTVLHDRYEEAHEFVEEMIASCLVPRLYQHAFFLLGPGEGGRSTLLDLIGRLLGGRPNVTHCELQRLTSDKFEPIKLMGSLANLFADLPKKALEDTSLFKMATGDDPIPIRRMYSQEQIYLNAICTFVFAGQRMPKADDSSHGYLRRILPLRIEFSIPKAQRRHKEKVLGEILEERSAILVRLVNRLRALKRRGKFEIPQCVEDERVEYRESIDNVAQFVGECINRKEGSRIPRKELYTGYKSWCHLNNHDKYIAKDREFYERLRSMRYAVQKEGNPRCVIGVEWKDDLYKNVVENAKKQEQARLRVVGG
jgi:P4 family phage/plasmid primase-like protien